MKGPKRIAVKTMPDGDVFVWQVPMPDGSKPDDDSAAYLRADVADAMLEVLKVASLALVRCGNESHALADVDAAIAAAESGE